MIVRQIRTSMETRGLIENLRHIYYQERFDGEEVTMTPGYVLNAAWDEVKDTNSWNVVINSNIVIDEKFYSLVKESKTPIIRFKLKDETSDGLDKLTKIFSDELDLKVQTGFTTKQIIKAAILLREKKNIYSSEKLDKAFDDAIHVVNFKGGFDSFKFRKGFEEEQTLSSETKEQILMYLRNKIKEGDSIFTRIKEQIDSKEFNSDYYQNPYPKTTRGAYYNVIIKTFAGIMLIGLEQMANDKDNANT